MIVKSVNNDRYRCSPRVVIYTDLVGDIELVADAHVEEHAHCRLTSLHLVQAQVAEVVVIETEGGS